MAFFSMDSDLYKKKKASRALVAGAVKLRVSIICSVDGELNLPHVGHRAKLSGIYGLIQADLYLFSSQLGMLLHAV